MVSLIGWQQKRVVQGVVVVLAASASCGCSSNWLWNSFLDQTALSGGFRRTMMSEIQQSLTFEDTPPGVPGAEEPTVEDTVAHMEEYRLAPTDSFEIRSERYDLDAMGRLSSVPVAFTTVVSEVGDAQIPQFPELGWINVEGMTAREVEREIRDRVVQQGLMRDDEQVVQAIQVSILAQHERMFSVTGAVSMPGPYRILEPDFRLLDGLSMVGGLPEQAEWIYVYRSLPRPKEKRVPVATPAETSVAPTLPPDRGPEVPPVAPVSLSGFDGASGALAQASPPPPIAGSEEELIEAIAPSTQTSAASAPAAEAQDVAPAPARPRYIFLNGAWVKDESPAPDAKAESEPAVEPEPGPEPQVAPAVPAEQPATAPAASPVTWETVAREDRQRIIRIPATALKHGESRYNIVIRDRDLIRVDPGPTGEFYMLGNVNRPGAYSLTGREVTLKQAIAAAGGVSALGWPANCEIVRRLDRDREQIIPVNLEQIFAGMQPDVYLRPDDIINVGTHILAPFLATIRTSFRMSYGFGFVYDRNFGDIDAYAGQQNPTDRRRRELQTRFPGLFQ
ncbi:MAG: SLBB domain-containing protein [Phycisphaerae bacterium]|nr:SLBB domain-containing protein [Phycisphaerae bacterium]